MATDIAQSTAMFTQEAWTAGYEMAARLGLTSPWAAAGRPVTELDVAQIVSAVANHGFEEAYTDHAMAEEMLDNEVAMASLRDHMQVQLAADVVRAGCVMLTLPHEVIDHGLAGIPGVARVRLIVPVRRLSS